MRSHTMTRDVAYSRHAHPTYSRPPPTGGRARPAPTTASSSRSHGSRTGAASTSSYGRRRFAYVLMHDKRGWQQPMSSADGRSDYLRLEYQGPEVEVEKGTLVEVDPSSNYRGISVNVVSIDRPEIKASLLMKELLPVEEEVFERLLPLSESQRYSILTDKIRYSVLGANVGDTVWVLDARNHKDVGMIQYIGPVQGLGEGTYFGVEFVDSNHGTSNGTFGLKRYFSAPPNSSVFVAADRLLPYDERSRSSRSSLVSLADAGTGQQESALAERFASAVSIQSQRAPKQQPALSASYDPKKYEDQHDRNGGGKDVDSRSAREAGPRKDTPTRNDGPQVMTGDRIVWISDQGPEYGVVRWIGHIPGDDDLLAGVEFDNPVGVGDGQFNRKRLFKTKKKHASLMPLNGLLRAEDLESSLGDEAAAPKKSPAADSGRREGVRRRSSSAAERSARRKEKLTPTQENERNEVEEAGSEDSDRRELVTPGDFQRNHRHRQEKGKDCWPIPRKQAPSNGLGSPSPKPRKKTPLPVFDRLEEKNALKDDHEVEAGMLVELHVQGEPVFGVVRWLGWLPDQDKKAAGVELEEEMLGATNGWHNGTQYFACADRKAVFVPFTHFNLDTRFGSTSRRRNSLDFGDMECPVVPGFHAPISGSDVEQLSGRNRGIQGHQNSCYLDATLFAMFSFTSVFDSLLYRPPSSKDIPEYGDVQRVLREEIVNPLRKNIFVRADRVMKLRKFLDHLSTVRGLTSEEKDPEEFLNSLLSQTLRAAPFLELSSGQSAYLYQLFVEKDEALKMPTVQRLFEQSFLTSNVKLKKVPSVLILQMPRFGAQFKVYNRILPTTLLDVTDIIEDSPRQCTICGKLATQECRQCFGDHGHGLDSTAFCNGCFAQVHSHHKRKKHQPQPLKYPEEFLLNCRTGDSVPRLFMELFAVVCIETSHYVSFVKCGLGPDAPWCFFDSMADRRGELDGYNIPEVKSASSVLDWLGEGGVTRLEATPDDKALPTQAKRLICDAYMCFYQSPQVMMYQ